MATNILPVIERIPCVGTYSQLLQVFKERRITAVAVINIPHDERWSNTTESYPGMRKICHVFHLAWHELETPEQACQFMFETNGRTYRSYKLRAEGMCTVGPFGFDQFIEQTRKSLELSGFIANSVETRVAVKRSK